MKIPLCGLAFLLSASLGVAQIPTTGLVARYLFAGTALDTGPNLLHATVHNGAALTTDRFGLSASAYVFDGNNDYLEIADHSLLSIPTTGALSFSVWLRPDVLVFPDQESTGYVHWMGKGLPGQHEYTFRMYGLGNTEGRDNRTSFYVFNLAGGESAGSYVQEPVTAGDWSHYVATVSIADDEIRWYQDGVLKDVDSFLGAPYFATPQDGTAPLRIGTRAASPSTSASYFLGAIDDVLIYDRVLTPSEVQQLYTVPEPGTAALITLAVPLVAMRRKRRGPW
jgi:hypothetical protein